LTLQATFQKALALHQAGELEAAEEIYRKILRAHPSHAPSLNQLGILSAQRKLFERSERLFKEAIRIAPSATYYFNLANALDMQGKQCAAKYYEKAIELNADYAEAYNNLGNLHRRSGRFQDAILSYRKAACLQPELAEAHHQLALCKTFESVDDDILAMQAVLGRRGLASEKKAHLCFGLGKAYEDLGEFQTSFDYYKMGNSLHRNTIEFDIGPVEYKFQRIMEIFDHALFEKFPEAGCKDETPVFIVGMPRSGTTLLEQILACHPDAHGAGELYDLRRIMGSCVIDGSLLSYPEHVPHLRGDMLGNMGERYVQRIRQYSSLGKIIDKMPQNFFYIGLIKLALPNAKVVHCTRNPVATCFSCFKQHFSNPHQYAYDLAELGSYYALYRRLMLHWNEVLPGFIHELKYEDLIHNQKEQVKQVLEFCGLIWDERCLAYYESGNTVKTASSVQVRRKLYSRSVDQWKNYADNLAPLLHSLGVSHS